ncbi:MAG: phage baseplate assembly protein V [Selenomonadaceae bacterium]|nr:phage baseplate assembly protein V [Selenomonadaceae bacterium]
MEGEARDLVKEGIVSEVYPARHSARVTFEDKDNVVSAELPIMTLWALDNKAYALPDIGETVLCLFATNADTTGEGWIIGSRFHDKSKPNANAQDVMRIDFKDGTSVEYNRKQHALKVECKGTLEIKCDKEISIVSEENMTLKGKNIFINEG